MHPVNLRRLSDAQQLTCLAVAVVAAAAACSGFDRGWATGHDSHFDVTGGTDLVGVDLKVSLGWWNATSSLHVEPLPAFTVTSATARSLGVFTCVLLGLSGIFALALLLSSLTDHLPPALRLDAKTESNVTAMLSLLILLASVSLYVSLVVGANQQLKATFKRGLWCYPDWAAAFALLSAGCWAIVARVSATAGNQPDGYLPI